MQSSIINNLLPNVILRNTIRLYARRGKVANPGLQQRLDLLSEKQQENEFDEDDFEELETDFMSVGELHKKYESETEREHERKRQLMIRRKYFKQEKINFLTWNDKEQIRFLYNTNPKEWNIDRLSEGFPALPGTISKLIHGKWQPESDKRKLKHDLAVEKNWKLLKEGKLSHLSKEVLDHVTKFTKRKPQTHTIKKIVINESNPQHQGEFGSIIDKYNELVNKNKNKNDTEKSKIEPLIEIGSGEKLRIKKENKNNLTTLSDLRRNIEKNVDSGKTVDDYDKMILRETSQSVNKNEIVTKMNENVSNLSNETYVIDNNEKKLQNTETKIIEALRYPERINIPKEKYKKGFTYKVNDCYYDDDGEFLYRVPGMR